MNSLGLEVLLAIVGIFLCVVSNLIGTLRKLMTVWRKLFVTDCNNAHKATRAEIQNSSENE